MPDDDRLALLFADRARDAVHDVDAPPSWTTEVPDRVRGRARRTRTVAALGTIAAAGVAAAVVVPLAGSDTATPPPGPSRLAAFTTALSQQADRHRLPCMTATTGSRSASGPSFSLGRYNRTGTGCTTLAAYTEQRVPRDATRVSDHVFLGRPTPEQRIGYVRYDVAGGRPFVLEVRVGRSVPRHRFVHLLDDTVGTITPVPTATG